MFRLLPSVPLRCIRTAKGRNRCHVLFMTRYRTTNCSCSRERSKAVELHGYIPNRKRHTRPRSEGHTPPGQGSIKRFDHLHWLTSFGGGAWFQAKRLFQLVSFKQITTRPKQTLNASHVRIRAFQLREERIFRKRSPIQSLVNFTLLSPGFQTRIWDVLCNGLLCWFFNLWLLCLWGWNVHRGQKRPQTRRVGFHIPAHRR